MNTNHPITISVVNDLIGYNEQFPFGLPRRYEVIVYDGGIYNYHLTSFNDFEKIKSLLSILGIEYQLKRSEENFIEYETSTIYKSVYFWDKESLPSNALHIKGLSNGSIVDCYFTNIDDVLTVYRPNPNNKDIYKPLPLKEHIEYCKNNPHV